MKDLDGVYEGEFVDGKQEGKGKKVYTSGEYKGYAYDGDWKKGLRWGQGKCQFGKGGWYEGGWCYDDPTGKGKMKYANGDFYEGTFANGDRQGYGVLKKKNGTVYKTNWQNDKKEGKGIIIENGREEEGTFKNDVFYPKINYVERSSKRGGYFPGLGRINEN